MVTVWFSTPISAVLLNLAEALRIPSTVFTSERMLELNVSSSEVITMSIFPVAFLVVNSN